MKYLILLLALFSATAQARETMCFTNDAGATTHIFKEGNLKGAINITKEGTYTLGTWSVVGTTVVHVEWVMRTPTPTTTERFYQINTFKRCEL